MDSDEAVEKKQILSTDAPATCVICFLLLEKMLARGDDVAAATACALLVAEKGANETEEIDEARWKTTIVTITAEKSFIRRSMSSSRDRQ